MDKQSPGDSLRATIKANQEAMHNMSSRLGELNKTRQELNDSLAAMKGSFEQFSSTVADEMAAIDEKVEAQTAAINDKTHSLINALYGKLKTEIASSHAPIQTDLNERINGLRQELTTIINNNFNAIKSQVNSSSADVTGLKSTFSKFSDTLAKQTEKLNSFNSYIQTNSQQLEALTNSIQPVPAKVDSTIQANRSTYTILIALLFVNALIGGYNAYAYYAGTSSAQSHIEAAADAPPAKEQPVEASPDNKSTVKKKSGKQRSN